MGLLKISETITNEKKGDGNKKAGEGTENRFGINIKDGANKKVNNNNNNIKGDGWKLIKTWNPCHAHTNNLQI